MTNLMQHAQRFLRDEEGAVALEYALMTVLIALAIILGATALGGGLNTLFTNIAECLPAPTNNCWK